MRKCRCVDLTVQVLIEGRKGACWITLLSLFACGQGLRSYWPQEVVIFLGWVDPYIMDIHYVTMMSPSERARGREEGGGYILCQMQHFSTSLKISVKLQANSSIFPRWHDEHLSASEAKAYSYILQQSGG